MAEDKLYLQNILIVIIGKINISIYILYVIKKNWKKKFNLQKFWVILSIVS